MLKKMMRFLLITAICISMMFITIPAWAATGVTFYQDADYGGTAEIIHWPN